MDSDFGNLHRDATPSRRQFGSAMRHLAFLAVLIASTAFCSESEQTLPITLKSSRGYKATLTDFTPPSLKDYIGTVIVIRNREGKIVFRDDSCLERKRAVNAVWTPSGDFLIITSVNGEGHSPWRYHVNFFSTRSSQLYSLEPPSSSAFVSPAIVVRPPNRVLLKAGSYGKLPAEAADHPKSISYELSDPAKS